MSRGQRDVLPVSSSLVALSVVADQLRLEAEPFLERALALALAYRPMDADAAEHEVVREEMAPGQSVQPMAVQHRARRWTKAMAASRQTPRRMDAPVASC